MSVALAFLRRDVLIWASYRLAVVWQAVGVFVFIGLVYFVGTTVGEDAELLAGQAGGYAAFALSGIAFTDLMQQGLYALPQTIREYQKSGTLEPMLLTPISPMSLALSSAIFRIVLATGRLVVYLGFASVVFGYWRDANVLSMLLVLAPALLSFLAIGALSAGFIVLVKQGEPVLVAYGAVTALLSGVFFPVAALPEWTQDLAAFLPLTHALAGLRAGLEGAPPAAVLGPVLVLAGMTAVLLPIGVVAFNWAVGRAKKEGSLAQY